MDTWQTWCMRRTENPENVVRVHECPQVMTREYSSVGRTSVSKTESRGFKSFCSCQTLGCCSTVRATDCKSVTLWLSRFDSYHPNQYASVAQWIRASRYEREGRKFESCRKYLNETPSHSEIPNNWELLYPIASICWSFAFTSISSEPSSCFSSRLYLSSCSTAKVINSHISSGRGDSDME